MDINIGPTYPENLCPNFFVGKCMAQKITYQRAPDQRVLDQSVPDKGSRKKRSRSNFGTFSVCPAQFLKRPEVDTSNVHKSRMYMNPDIHMGVWDPMKCIPIGLPNIGEEGVGAFPLSSPVPSIKTHAPPRKTFLNKCFPDKCHHDNGHLLSLVPLGDKEKLIQIGTQFRSQYHQSKGNNSGKCCLNNCFLDKSYHASCYL